MQEYNIYNLVNICIKTNNSKYKKYFDNEYSKMQTKLKKSADSISVVVKIGTLPKKQDGDIAGERKFKKLFTFRYIVRNINDTTTELYFENHFIDKIYINAVGVYLQAQLLEPILYYKLLNKNVLFMHAAGVTKDKKGYLMPAYGGTGKTTTSLKLLAKGYKLLGDDLLLVDINNKQVFAYPRPFHLFTYNISSLENATVPFKYRFIIRFKNYIRFILEKLTGEEFLISTRVHADELYKGKIWADKVPYKKIIFLKKEGKTEKYSLDSESERTLNAKKIIASADLNDSLYENIFLDKKSSDKSKRLELDVVKNLLNDFAYITFLNTRATSDEEIEELFSV